MNFNITPRQSSLFALVTQFYTQLFFFQSTKLIIDNKNCHKMKFNCMNITLTVHMLVSCICICVPGAELLGF